MDITLCSNSDNCKNKKECVRHVLKNKASGRQSWSDFYEFNKECTMFLKLK